MHSLCLLQHQLPQLLVEWRQILGACGSYAGKLLHKSFKRSLNSSIQESRRTICCWTPDIQGVMASFVGIHYKQGNRLCCLHLAFSKSRASSAKGLHFSVVRGTPGVVACWLANHALQVFKMGFLCSWLLPTHLPASPRLPLSWLPISLSQGF